MKTKIEAMYEYSGGTDYRHLCTECNNFMRVFTGSRTVFKCRIYGDTASEASDWRASYIACKAFNQPYDGRPLIDVLKHTSKKKEETGCDGQMSIYDFPELLP